MVLKSVRPKLPLDISSLIQNNFSRLRLTFLKRTRWVYVAHPDAFEIMQRRFDSRLHGCLLNMLGHLGKDASLDHSCPFRTDILRSSGLEYNGPRPHAIS